MLNPETTKRPIEGIESGKRYMDKFVKSQCEQSEINNCKVGVGRWGSGRSGRAPEINHNNCRPGLVTGTTGNSPERNSKMDGFLGGYGQLLEISQEASTTYKSQQ
jgi:hypothetical protein